MNPLWKGQPIHSARMMEVIEVKVTRGVGTEENPCRIVTQYWSQRGELLAESDSTTDTSFASSESNYPDH